MSPLVLSRVAMVALALAAACGGDDGPTPDARPRTDAAMADAAMADAAMPDAMPDAAIDASPDAPPTDSDLIGFARATPDGTGLTLPIMNAIVTYLKPAIGTDPAGFTIQVAPTGPALFIVVDPATLTPMPVVGSVVSFTITTMGTLASLRTATAISGFTSSSTVSVGPLVQDVTAVTDIVAMIGNYESELIDVRGTIAGAFGNAGSPFVGADITTTGVSVTDTNYEIRLPESVRDGLDLVMGCSFELIDVPVGRFSDRVQLPAYVAGDIMVSGCPPPTVVSAVALSATSVQVRFSRRVLATSLMANGSQFTFDNTLTASAATLDVDPRVVIVTTSAQVIGTTYTLTVANTITDLQSSVIGTPNTAMFGAFVTPAVVRINEVNANIATGCDLIELRVMSGGSMTGFKIQERVGGMNELSLTFSSFVVATNDIIVVHTSGTTAATCNPGTGTQETTSVMQQPASTFTRNYDSAYDWYSTDTGLTGTDNVITLYNAAGVIVDVVLIDDDTAATVMTPSNVAASSETQAAAAAAANQWQMNGGGIPVAGVGGVPPAGFVDDNFRTHAVLESDSPLTTAHTGANSESLRRIDNTDENEKSDWLQGANTWGLLNAGQTAF